MSEYKMKQSKLCRMLGITTGCVRVWRSLGLSSTREGSDTLIDLFELETFLRDKAKRSTRAVGYLDIVEKLLTIKRTAA